MSDPRDPYVRPTRSAPNGDRLWSGAMPRALRAIEITRDESADDMAVILDRCDRQQLYAIVTVLACLVPDDRPVADLLAWSDPTKTPGFCGTERGYQWHREHDRGNWPLPADDPCGCRAAHRAHVALRKMMNRSKVA